jgi:hypothetical protein
MVTEVRVAIDQHVTLPGNAADAFRVVRQGDGAIVSLGAAVDDAGAGTVVTLRFAGADVVGNSLADGSYTLTVAAAQVSGNDGLLDGDGDGQAGGDFSQGLFRLFGDINGDRRVDVADFGLFSTTFNLSSGQNGFLAGFDFNGDGRIDIADFGQFSIRFFTTLP